MHNSDDFRIKALDLLEQAKTALSVGSAMSRISLDSSYNTESKQYYSDRIVKTEESKALIEQAIAKVKEIK
jgi:hypothetical protein